jgi:hypothetical protein
MNKWRYFCFRISEIAFTNVRLLNDCVIGLQSTKSVYQAQGLSNNTTLAHAKLVT